MVFWIALASSKSWISEIRLLDQSRCENRSLWEITQSSAKKTKKRRPTSRRFGSRRSPYLADGPASVAPETTEVADATSFDSDIAVHGVSIHLSADPAADVDSRDGTTRYESGDPRSSRSGDDDLAPEGEGTTAANGGDGAADDPFSDPVAASTMAKILASAAATRLREVAPDAGVSSPIPSRRRTTKMDRSASTPKPARRKTGVPDVASPKGRRTLEREMRRLSRARSASDRPDRYGAALEDDADPSSGSDTPDSTTPLRREDRSSSVAGAAARHRRPGRSLRDSPSRHLDKSPSLASVAEDEDGEEHDDFDDFDDDFDEFEGDSTARSSPGRPATARGRPPAAATTTTTTTTTPLRGARRALRSVSTFLFGATAAAGDRGGDASGNSTAFATPYASKRASVVRNGENPADGEASHARSGPPPPPTIRLRRTSSYYVAGGACGGDRGGSGFGSFGGFSGAGDASTREERERARRNELARYRGRCAAAGKLAATTLAGTLAGVVLWAMTTVTAQLTMAKFDATRALLGNDDGALPRAWAFYCACAVACVGATAFGILHPKGAPMARGSGIPELKGYLNGNRQQGLFHWRTFLGRSVGICLVITATMPFGREGPSVHIGACAASVALNLPWRTYLGWQPSPEERRQILQLGSAAGVAAAFNAPIGGLLYVMEEVASNLPPDYVWRAFMTAGVAVGVALVLYSANEGRVDYASLVISDPNGSSTGWGVADLPLVAVLAALAGALSAAYTVAADYFGSWRRRPGAWTPRWLANAMGTRWGMWLDAVLGAALNASMQVLLPAAFGCRAAPTTSNEYGPDGSLNVYTGRRKLTSSAIYIPRTFVQYTCEPGDFSEMATLMLQNEEGVVKHLFARDELYSEKLFTAPVVFAFLAYFFFIASVTFGGAFPAGVFIPNMLMGASLGRLFGFFAEQVSPSVNKGTYALIGSAAMLSGFTRMTAAVTVIIIEATASMDVLAPIILACVIARAVSMAIVSHSLDERLIIAKGVPFLEHHAHPSTAAVKIGDALKEADSRRGPIIAFRKQERLEVLLNALLLTEHNAFPVLDDVENNTGLGGLVTRAMLQRVLRIVLETDDDDDDDADADADADAEAEADADADAKAKADASSKKTAAAPRRSTPMLGPGRSSWSRKSIEKWCVEGVCPARRDSRKRPVAASSSSSLGDDASQVIIHIDDDVQEGGKRVVDDERDVDAISSTSSNAGGSLKTPPSTPQAASPTAKEGCEFMTSLARWTARNARKGLHNLHLPNLATHAVGARHGVAGSKHAGGSGGGDDDVPTRVGAAAARSGAHPAAERRGDENHFDELKEGTSIVDRLRRGVMNVPGEQLTRMVDLTHAVDKAPWTVDSCMKLARVHNLFARLGVRHLCVVSDNGQRLEGIITRHDLIHVHRLAEEGR